jgi:diguanylate cyclase (GGDEF)-like protein/PAS domain S-box-containing protein
MDADLFAEPAAMPGATSARWTRWRSRLARLRWPRWPRWLESLQTRLALGGLLVLLLGLLLTVWMLGQQAERVLLQQAGALQQAEAERLARGIQRHVAGLQRSLQMLVPQIDDNDVLAPAQAAGILARSGLAGEAFSNLYLAAPDGALVAYVDSAGSRHPPLSLADRDYFRQAVHSRLPVVSPPVAGRISGEPVVIFAQPVVRDGRLVAVVGGAMRLASRDLLQDLREPVASHGPVRIVLSDAHGQVLAHPERHLIARPLREDTRLAAASLRWLAGDVAGASASWLLGDDLVSTASEGLAGWQVWHVVPQASLLAPLRQARNDALRDAAVLALAAAAALALFLHWQFRPLARLQRRAAALLDGDVASPWPAAGGEIGRLTRTLKHVWAERSQADAFNAEVLQKLGSVMSAAPVGLAFTRNHCFELVSVEFCRLLGHAEAQILGQRTQVIFASNEDYAALGPLVMQAFRQGLPYAGEWQLLRADGSRFWGLLRARPVAADDAAAGTIWSVNDVTDQVQSRRLLEHAAHHDALTGVVNRPGFELSLQAVFDAQPGSRPAALVMIDLDHFKPINDTAGHAAGDAMLVAVAQAISTRVRGSDLVVRLGGDEFAVLLPGCTHERALAVAEKVREAITALALTWEGHTLRVGASLGVAELGDQHTSPAQWLAQADAACYEAKRQGRGRVQTARPGLRLMAAP